MLLTMPTSLAALTLHLHSAQLFMTALTHVVKNHFQELSQVFITSRHSVLRIGFQQTTYEVEEEAGSATVVFGVLQGVIDREVTVDFDFTSGTAIG